MVETYVNDKECPIPEPLRANLGPVLFITVLFFLTFLGRFIYAPLMPTIETDLGITHSQAGSLFLMMSLGFLVGQVFSGFLASRVEHRGALVISTLAVGLTLLLFVSTPSLWAFRGILLLLGMAAGLHMPSAIATITAMVDRRDWGKALAFHQSAPPSSLVLGPLLVIFMLHWFSWQAALVILGVINVGAGLAFLRFGRCGRFPGDSPRWSRVKVVISRRSFWIMVVLFALAMGGTVGIYTMLPLFLVNERGFDQGWANTLLGLSRISGLFMVFAAGWFTDRVGEKAFIFVVMLASGVATVMLGVMTGTWLVVIFFVQPAIEGCYFTAGFAALARIVQPNYRSIAAAFTTPVAFFFGGGLLPMAIGYMGEAFSFGLGIVLLGGITIVGSGLVYFLTLIDQMEEGC